MQRGCSGDVDGDFVVGGGGCGQSAADDTGDFHIIAGEGQRRAGFNPAGGFLNDHTAVGGLQQDAGQSRAAGAQLAVDRQIVDTGECDGPAGQGLDRAGPVGPQAVCARQNTAAGRDRDVVVSPEVAAEFECFRGSDGDVGSTAAGDDVAVHDTGGAGAEINGSTAGFQQTSNGQVEADAVGVLAAVQVDGFVCQHFAGNGQLAVGARGSSDGDHRVALRGIQGVGQTGLEVT